MSIAEPVTHGPGIDVQALVVVVTTGRGSTRITHRTELPGDFVHRIEVALAHFDPVPDHVTGLVGVFRGPNALRVVETCRCEANCGAAT